MLTLDIVHVKYDSFLYRGLEFPLFSCDDEEPVQFVTLRTKEDFKHALHIQEEEEEEVEAIQPRRKVLFCHLSIN